MKNSTNTQSIGYFFKVARNEITGKFVVFLYTGLHPTVSLIETILEASKK